MRPVSILLLEDSALDADLTMSRLQKTGLEMSVHRVETRDQYEKALSNGSLDLILADYHLPDFDGLTALRIAREKCPTVPFIFVSGLMGEDIAIESLHKGATDYVLKARLERLVPAVQRALAESDEKKYRKQTQEEFDRFFSLSPDLFGVYSTADRRWLRVNASFVSTLGYSEQQLSSKGLCELFHPDDVAVLRDEQRTWGNGRATQNMEVRMICRNANEKWISWSVTPYPAEQVLYWAGRDITNQKAAEEVLAQQAEDLASSNAELQQFAYVTSHDLQEPLRSISTYAELLTRRYQGSLDSSADEFLGFIIGGVQRMQSLIDGLLIYSRLVNVTASVHTRVEMEGVLHWALMNLNTRIDGSGAVITHDPLPAVTGDQIQLVQLIQNLIDNAIKYRGDNAPKIHISAEEKGDQYEFVVRDNGIGIEERYIDRIFGVFKRLHGREIPGTGIGLAICKKIVERHGGRIWVESRPHVGSTFHFTLPAN